MEAATLTGDGAVRWLLPYVTVAAALADLPDPVLTGDPADGADGVSNHVAMRHSSRVQEKIATLTPGVGPISYRKLSLDRPAHTVIAGHNALPTHPVALRSITVREAARLQSFPDDFRFLGPKHSQALQVANAVPPRFAHAMAVASSWLVHPNTTGGAKPIEAGNGALGVGDVNRVRDLMARGWGDPEIAEAMCVSASAIRRFRLSHGIMRRSAKELPDELVSGSVL
jgi:hypothetical protein